MPKKVKSVQGKTIYPEIREKIRNIIIKSDLGAGAKLPTEASLSETLGVNQLTVRRALNDLESEGLVVRRRGSGTYLADPAHPPFLLNRPVRIGLLWKAALTPNALWNSYLGEITQGILKSFGIAVDSGVWPKTKKEEATRVEWKSADQRVTIIGLGESESSYLRCPPWECVLHANLDAYFTIAIIEEEFLQKLSSLQKPLVVCDALNENLNTSMDQVFVDPNPGYANAVKYFYQKGLRKIHFVGALMSIPHVVHGLSEDNGRGPSRIDPDTLLRYSVFKRGIQECDLPFQENWFHKEVISKPHLENLAQNLLLLPKEARPQAIICHSISQAETIIKVFKEKGVPLVGAGTGEQQHVGQALPIVIDLVDMGVACAELLISRLYRPKRIGLRVGAAMTFHGPAEKRK